MPVKDACSYCSMPMKPFFQRMEGTLMENQRRMIMQMLKGALKVPPAAQLRTCSARGARLVSRVTPLRSGGYNMYVPVVRSRGPGLASTPFTKLSPGVGAPEYRVEPWTTKLLAV